MIECKLEKNQSITLEISGKRGDIMLELAGILSELSKTLNLTKDQIIDEMTGVVERRQKILTKEV